MRKRTMLQSYQLKIAMTNSHANVCRTLGRGYYYSIATLQECVRVPQQLTTDNSYFLSIHHFSIVITSHYYTVNGT